VSSADEHTQRVGQLIERLLLDAPFRAEFRKDPAGACRELGLADLADELGHSGKSMHTLELRESKSSLAGVVMAVAAEGIGVVELHGLVEHGLLKGNLRAAGEHALRGVNPMHPASSLRSELRGENPLRGAAHNPLGAAQRDSQLAGQAERSAGGEAASPPGAPATAGPVPAPSGQAPPPLPTAAAQPGSPAPIPTPSSQPPSSAPVTPGAGGGGAAQTGTPTPSAPSAPAAPAPAGAGGAQGATGGGAGSPTPPPVPPVPGAQPAAGGAAAVWPEPSQTPTGPGAAGGAAVADLSGQGAVAGTGSPGLAALLESPHLALPPDVRAVLAQGNVDPRLVSVLDDAVAHHNIVIGDIETATEPVHAQAIDIISVDGQPVGPGNVAARDLVTEIAALEPGTRPNEIGTPWPIQSQGFFTDAQHQNRLHLAFTSTAEYDPQAPAGSAPATTASSGSPAASAQEVAGGSGASGHAAGAAATGAAAAPSDPNWASAKAHAAYEVAKHELGVPYLWGGTSPKTGFDCSGLVQYAYRQAGIDIPRVAAEQFHAGTPVDLSHLREGDLVFFQDSTGYIHHVGMYVGDHKFIQAPQTGEKVDYGDLRDPYFAQQFAGGRRIAPLTAPPAPSAAGSAPAAGGDAPAPGAPTPGAAVPTAAEGTPVAAPSAAAPAGAGAAPAAPVAGAPGIQAAAEPLPPESPPRPGTAVFKALQAQEASYLRHTVKFLQAIPPPGASPPAGQAPGVGAAAQAAGQTPSSAADQVVGEPEHVGGAAAAAGVVDAAPGTIPYPGDNAPKAEIAQWMGDIAQKHGLPRELPVMASLVESSLHNDVGGDRDSVGYFQMRTGIWDKGPYAGYPHNPALQLQWFIDQAVAAKDRMLSGNPSFGTDPSHYGDWVAEVEQPAYEYRGRYQLQLDAARALLGER
jgi:cell wall-associated NlpC family hydrolase